MSGAANLVSPSSFTLSLSLPPSPCINLTVTTFTTSLTRSRHLIVKADLHLETNQPRFKTSRLVSPPYPRYYPMTRVSSTVHIKNPRPVRGHTPHARTNPFKPRLRTPEAAPVSVGMTLDT